MVRASLFLFIITLAALSVVAQNSNTIQVIPRPRTIETKQDVFRLGSNTRVVLADPRSEDDRFADSVLARYDQAIAMWLNKSKALAEAVRTYNTNSTLPDPEAFGLGPRPTPLPTPVR